MQKIKQERHDLQNELKNEIRKREKGEMKLIEITAKLDSLETEKDKRYSHTECDTKLHTYKWNRVFLHA